MLLRGHEPGLLLLLQQLVPVVKEREDDLLEGAGAELSIGGLDGGLGCY